LAAEFLVTTPLFLQAIGTKHYRNIMAKPRYRTLRPVSGACVLSAAALICCVSIASAGAQVTAPTNNSQFGIQSTLTQKRDALQSPKPAGHPKPAVDSNNRSGTQAH
jgi:hypothetical protein